MKPSNKLLGERLIPLKKITHYLLDADHPEGGGKAKFFAAHGFKVLEPDTLAKAVHAHAESNDIGEIEQSDYGTKTIVRCSIQTPDGRNPCIQVVWIREKGCNSHRLVTAYPTDNK